MIQVVFLNGALWEFEGAGATYAWSDEAGVQVLDQHGKVVLDTDRDYVLAVVDHSGPNSPTWKVPPPLDNSALAAVIGPNE